MNKVRAVIMRWGTTDEVGDIYTRESCENAAKQAQEGGKIQSYTMIDETESTGRVEVVLNQKTLSDLRSDDTPRAGDARFGVGPVQQLEQGG